MAKKYTRKDNQVPFQYGIHVNGQVPIDDRSVLDYEDLYITDVAKVSCPLYAKAYQGMVVAVFEQDGTPSLLVLKDAAPYTPGSVRTVSAANFLDFWKKEGKATADRLEQQLSQNLDPSIDALQSRADKTDASVNGLESYVSAVNLADAQGGAVTVTPAKGQKFGAVSATTYKLGVNVDGQAVKIVGDKVTGREYKIDSASVTGDYLSSYALYYRTVGEGDDKWKSAGTINIPKDYLISNVHLCKCTSAGGKLTETVKFDGTNRDAYDKAAGEEYIHIVWNVKSGTKGAGELPDTYLKVSDVFKLNADKINATIGEVSARLKEASTRIAGQIANLDSSRVWLTNTLVDDEKTVANALTVIDASIERSDASVSGLEGYAAAENVKNGGGVAVSKKTVKHGGVSGQEYTLAVDVDGTTVKVDGGKVKAREYRINELGMPKAGFLKSYKIQWRVGSGAWTDSDGEIDIPKDYWVQDVALCKGTLKSDGTLTVTHKLGTSGYDADSNPVFVRVLWNTKDADSGEVKEYNIRVSDMVSDETVKLNKRIDDVSAYGVSVSTNLSETKSGLSDLKTKFESHKTQSDSSFVKLAAEDASIWNAIIENEEITAQGFAEIKGTGIKVEDSSNEADLDIADEENRVIMRLYGGHVRTRYFDSSSVVSDVNELKVSDGSIWTKLDEITGSDKQDSLQTQLTSLKNGHDDLSTNYYAHKKSAEADVAALKTAKSSYDDKFKIIDGSIGVIDASVLGLENNGVKVVDVDSSTADLDIADEENHVIMRLYQGHVKTRYFDSSAVVKDLAVTDASVAAIEKQGRIIEEVDNGAEGTTLRFVDAAGNKVMDVSAGDIETGNFRSREVPKKIDVTEAFKAPKETETKISYADVQMNNYLFAALGQSTKKNYSVQLSGERMWFFTFDSSNNSVLNYVDFTNSNGKVKSTDKKVTESFNH